MDAQGAGLAAPAVSVFSIDHVGRARDLTNSEKPVDSCASRSRHRKDGPTRAVKKRHDKAVSKLVMSRPIRDTLPLGNSVIARCDVRRRVATLNSGGADYCSSKR